MKKKIALGIFTAIAFALATAPADAAGTKKKSGKSKGKTVAAKVEKKQSDGGPIGFATCALSTLGSVLGAKKNCG